MSTATLTFDEMELRADRALAVALFAKHLKNAVVCGLALAFLDQFIKSLVKTLSAEKLMSLSAEQRAALTQKLQQLHANLVRLLTIRGIEKLKSRPMFGGSIRGLEENAEDLMDVIEDLVMSEKREFRTLVAESAARLAIGTRGSV